MAAPEEPWGDATLARLLAWFDPPSTRSGAAEPGRFSPWEGRFGSEGARLNEYEILLMLDVDIPEERAEEILSRMRELIEKEGGSWDGHEPWGRRKLAYEIAHKS